MLVISCYLFALTGDYVTFSKSMPVDRFTFTGQSVVVNAGAVSVAGRYIVNNGHVTITCKSFEDSEREVDFVFKISNDTLTGINTPFTNIKYIKYNASKSNNIESFHGNNAIPPVVPIIYKTYNTNGQATINVTESYYKAVGGERSDGEGNSIDLAYIQASKIILLYQQMGYPFKNYIADYQINESNGQFKINVFVQSQTSLQKLDMMNDPMEQFKFLYDLSRPYFRDVINTYNIIDTYNKMSKASYFYLSTNSWYYNQLFSKVNGFIKEPKFTNEVMNIKNAVDNIEIYFVVCDDNWQPKHWIECFKESSLISLSKLDLNDPEMLKGIQEIYDKLIVVK